MLVDRLSDVFPTYPGTDTDLSAWMESHDEELSRLDQDLEYVEKSLQILNAEGEDLEAIGREYGPIGRRRGRDEEEYRLFLMTLAQAYSGRGTKPGVIRAIAAGLNIDAEDENEVISITEHFDDQQYQIGLSDWPAHRSSTIREMADLADPSGVEQIEPVFYELAGAEIGFAAEETRATGIKTVVPNVTVSFAGEETVTGDISTSSDECQIVVSGQETTSQTTKIGLSAHQLGNGNTLGDGK